MSLTMIMKKEWAKGSIVDKYIITCLAGGVATLGSWLVHEASKTLTKVCSVHKIVPISALPVFEAFEKMTLTCFKSIRCINSIVAFVGFEVAFRLMQFEAAQFAVDRVSRVLLRNNCY